MNSNYTQVIASLLFPFLGISQLSAQTLGTEFLQCPSAPVSLCVQDDGIRLPVNNQLYLGAENPDATTCSVHVTQKQLVLTTCDGPLQYEVQLFIGDTSTAYILKPLTTITAHSNGMAELYFNTEESPDALISTSGIPYTTGCLRYHRIKWIVYDTCGAEIVCEQLIDLYDCSKPVPKLPGWVHTIPIPMGCQLTLFAKDFDLGVLDDCNQQFSLDYSFEEDRYKPDSMIQCNPFDIGVELPWKIWAADAGVDQNCDGQIEWKERNSVEQPFSVLFTLMNSACCEPSMTTLSGYIRDVFEHGVGNVTISLTSPNQIYPTFTTTQSGFYVYDIIPPGDTVTITPSKNDNHKNGVSTLDLVKIQKHILGNELFSSPYQSIAGDVNNSQYMSAIDLIQVRKIILGIDTEFPDNTSWRFVRKDHIFGDTIHPWPVYDGESITINDLDNPGNTDFIAIKIGDVNGSAQPRFTDVKPRGGLTPFNLQTHHLEYKNGEIIKVPIRITSSQTMTGFQFTLSATGMELVDVLPGRIAITEAEYALFGNKMTVSWFDENNVDVAADDVLFTLVLKAKQDGNVSQSLSINSDITEAEIYLNGEQTFLPVLNVDNPIKGSELKIVSCSPNPWKDETTVSFYLPETNNVTYNVMDVNGRKIFTNEEYLNEGYHFYTLRATDFSARGMLFLEINSGGNTVVQKMVVLK